MAKLQKQLSRKVGDKEYVKYIVVLPSEIVREAGLEEGGEIEIEFKDNKIVLKKPKLALLQRK